MTKYITSGLLTVVLSLFSSIAAAQTDIPRPEHPNPIMMRADWQTLNGRWEFEFDDQDRGLVERWYAGGRNFTKTIQVPFAFQSRLSGISDTAFHDVVWYRRSVQIPASFKSKRVMLNFGAVDYEATVWVNGDRAGDHRGGHVGFALDITDHLKSGDNVITVRVWDREPITASTRQAVLAAEIAGHLVHAHDGHLATGLDRSGVSGSRQTAARHAER